MQRNPIPAYRRSRRRRGPRRIVSRRSFLSLAALGALFLVNEAELLPPVGPLASDFERVDQRFTRCGAGRSFACVVDGDTFRLGSRRIRIAGIDAPELRDPACPRERQLAEASTEKLLELLNEGPFTMAANRFDSTDRYGRALRHLNRSLPNGDTQSIAQAMREAGLANRYLGAATAGWCGFLS